MRNQAKRVSRLLGKASLVLKDDPQRFISRGAKYAYHRTNPSQKTEHIFYKDVLFIDGTNIDYLVRYRIGHLMEQLAANGMTSDYLYVGQLTIDLVLRYRAFVFYRNIPNDTIKEFIALAKYYNKTCFFNIDDLVIDTEYTDTIKSINKLPREQRKEYDSGVRGYGEMMRLCSYSITTTQPLALEMKNKGSGSVLVNRNVMSQDMLKISDQAIKDIDRNPDRVVLGYFSGSDTHDLDFKMLLPTLQKIMKKHDNVYLKLVGRVTPPAGLEKFADRLILVPFMHWTLLPAEIRSCDINLGPLAENTIFNRCKSEIKWCEAALVRTVTVASKIGAFESEIKDGITGILVENDQWHTKLEFIITDTDLRRKIADNAHREVREKRTTLNAGGRELAGFIKGHMAKNLIFVIPSIDISGGINVIFKHAGILRERGYDVTLISLDGNPNLERLTLLRRKYNVIVNAEVEMLQIIDKMVATHWSTFTYMKKSPKVASEYYLVQGYESLIYPPGDRSRIAANATYADRTGIHFITISPWCVWWLKNNFNQDAKYAPNGIALANFPVVQRDYDKKIQILIEGNHKDALKNIDEAFSITNLLPRDKYSVSYLSYNAGPKEWYVVDNVYNKVNPDEVGRIYAQHHILIKTSLLESFSFPPLEMMATGGQVVIVLNEGNAEYVTNKNSVVIEAGNITAAVDAIESLVEDSHRIKALSKNGLITVKKYDWNKLTEQIFALYD